MVKCRVCGTELIVGKNWYPSLKKKKDYICKKCLYQKTKNAIYKWRKKNYKKWRKYQNKWNREHKEQKRNWQRIHSLGQHNKVIYGLNKRPYPKDGRCEICGQKSKRLFYHHWNDENLNMGIWVCFNCHQLAELIDKNYFSKYGEKYLKTKEYLEKNVF